MKEYGTYVFDLDNTLVDSSHGMELALKTAFDQYGMKYDPAKYEEYITTPLDTTFSKFHPNQPGMFREFVSLVISVYDRYYNVSVDLFPDARICITELYGRGKKMGIVSNSLTQHIDSILTGLDVRHMFGSVVGADRCDRAKPDPDPVLLCLRELESNPRDAIMIGDGENDVKAGLRAGTDALFIDRKNKGIFFRKAETISDMKEILAPFRQS